MQTLLNSILDSIPEDANFLTFFLFFSFASFVYCLSQANVIYDFFEKVNKREILKLKDLLADENISKQAKRTIRNEIDSIIYKKITGISSEKDLQEKIINYHELSEGKLRYSDFQKAKSFLKIERDGRLNIRTPNIFERILQIYWFFMSVLVFFFICLLLFALGFTTISIREQIAILLSIIYFGFMLLFFFDRILICQALQHGLIIATVDKNIRDYSISVL